MTHNNTKKITAGVASVIVSTGMVMNANSRRVKATGKREDEIVEVVSLKRADTETTKAAAVQTPKIKQTVKVKKRTQTVTQMIHYVDEDERPVHDDYTTSLVFEQTGIMDQATGQQAWNGKWLPKTSSAFKPVPHPVVKNHHLANPEVTEVKEYYVAVTDDTFKNPMLKVHKVVYKHNMEEIKRTQVVTQTIHYKYADGTTAHDDHVSSLIFTQSGKRDMTNGKEIWDDNWTLTQTFAAVTSPIISGYTADKKEISPVNITLNNKNFIDKQDKEETVIYSKQAVSKEGPITSESEVVTPHANEVPKAENTRVLDETPQIISVSSTELTTNSDNEAALPQTGESKKSTIVVVLSSLLSAIGLAGLIGAKKLHK